MKPWLFLLAFLLTACSGCTAMEDFILGPDPFYAGQASSQPTSGGCGAPPPIINTAQTQEPPR